MAVSKFRDWVLQSTWPSQTRWDGSLVDREDQTKEAASQIREKKKDTFVGLTGGVFDFGRLPMWHSDINGYKIGLRRTHPLNLDTAINTVWFFPFPFCHSAPSVNSGTPVSPLPSCFPNTIQNSSQLLTFLVSSSPEPGFSGAQEKKTSYNNSSEEYLLHGFSACWMWLYDLKLARY